MDLCNELHILLDLLPHHRFPFAIAQIPKNGLYILFEDGEKAHGTDRIVRVGNHTGQDQLRSRLNQHFIFENKDRSIFRKNIGRALLNKDRDPFLEQWEIDLTPHATRAELGSRIDIEKQRKEERQVTGYIQSHFRFIVIPILLKENRLLYESRIISTIARCHSCRPSPNWLGFESPKEKIRESGLWQVNELSGQPLTQSEFDALKQLILTDSM